MANISYDGDFKSASTSVAIHLTLIQFKDEDGVNIIYAPFLDLSGYGHTVKEAKDSFEVVLADFLDYTINKKTIGKVLKKLGWDMKGSVKRPIKFKPPTMSEMIKSNNYVSEIFDKYPTNTYHKEVGIPAYA